MQSDISSTLRGDLQQAVEEGRNSKENREILTAAVSLPRLMDQRDLAAYLGKSTAWCERARWAGEGPAFVKLGRHVRYRADDVLEWIDANTRTCSGMGV